MHTINKRKLKKLLQYLSAALFALFIALVLLFSLLGPNIKGAETQATVTGISTRTNGDAVKHTVNIKYSVDGRIFHDELEQIPNVDVGQQITVRYDTENPSTVWIPNSKAELAFIVIILCVFVVVFFMPFILEVRNILKIQYLMKNGQSIYVDFVKFVFTKRRCTLICEWVDPNTGKKHTFSGGISNKTRNIVIEHDIQNFEVRIEPDNPKNYIFTFQEANIYANIK